jgi:hypothetical protein
MAPSLGICPCAARAPRQRHRCPVHRPAFLWMHQLSRADVYDSGPRSRRCGFCAVLRGQRSGHETPRNRLWWFGGFAHSRRSRGPCLEVLHHVTVEAVHRVENGVDEGSTSPAALRAGRDGQRHPEGAQFLLGIGNEQAWILPHRAQQFGGPVSSRVHGERLHTKPIGGCLGDSRPPRSWREWRRPEPQRRGHHEPSLGLSRGRVLRVLIS